MGRSSLPGGAAEDYECISPSCGVLFYKIYNVAFAGPGKTSSVGFYGGHFGPNAGSSSNQPTDYDITGPTQDIGVYPGSDVTPVYVSTRDYFFDRYPLHPKESEVYIQMFYRNGWRGSYWDIDVWGWYLVPNGLPAGVVLAPECLPRLKNGGRGQHKYNGGNAPPPPRRKKECDCMDCGCSCNDIATMMARHLAESNRQIESLKDFIQKTAIEQVNFNQKQLQAISIDLDLQPVVNRLNEVESNLWNGIKRE